MTPSPPDPKLAGRTNGWAIAAKIEGEFSSTTTSYAGQGSVKYTW